MKYHFTSNIMAIIKNSVKEDVEKWNPHILLVRM